MSPGAIVQGHWRHPQTSGSSVPGEGDIGPRLRATCLLLQGCAHTEISPQVPHVQEIPKPKSQKYRSSLGLSADVVDTFKISEIQQLLVERASGTLRTSPQVPLGLPTSSSSSSSNESFRSGHCGWFDQTPQVLGSWLFSNLVPFMDLH